MVSKKEKNLLKLLKGYKKANNIILKEKENFLKGLSIEDSFQKYKYLCDLWEKLNQGKKHKKIDKLKINYLLKRRKLINKLGNFSN